MTESESVALPFGDSPLLQRSLLYMKGSVPSSTFFILAIFQHIFNSVGITVQITLELLPNSYCSVKSSGSLSAFPSSGPPSALSSSASSCSSVFSSAVDSDSVKDSAGAFVPSVSSMEAS